MYYLENTICSIQITFFTWSIKLYKIWYVAAIYGQKINIDFNIKCVTDIFTSMYITFHKTLGNDHVLIYTYKET